MDALVMIAKITGWTLLAVWLLWIMFVCVMRLQMLRNKGALTTGIKIFGYPTLAVGLVLDLLINVVVCSVVFMELPQELTVSARLWRHSNQAQGWRKDLALMLRTQLLDPADPKGIHRG